MKRSLTIAIAAMITGQALSVAAQTRSTSPESQGRIVTAEAARGALEQNRNAEDNEFLVEAMRTSLAVAKLGELATQRGQDPRVRDYGAKLKDAHSAHAAEIERLLKPLSVTAPTEPSADALEHHAALSRLSGAEFDAAFVETMVATHTESIEEYGGQTHANPDRSLHDFATKGLEMLRAQLAAAEALR